MELTPLYATGFAVGTTLFVLVLFHIVQRLLAPEKTARKAFADTNVARHLLHVAGSAGKARAEHPALLGDVEHQGLD